MEILKTKGDAHSGLTGFLEITREFPGEKITDRFRAVRKLDSAEDAEGNCYDWYEIDCHNTVIDRTPMLAAKLDYLCMMTGVDMPEEGGENDGTQPEV